MSCVESTRWRKKKEKANNRHWICASVDPTVRPGLRIYQKWENMTAYSASPQLSADLDFPLWRFTYSWTSKKLLPSSFGRSQTAAHTFTERPFWWCPVILLRCRRRWLTTRFVERCAVGLSLVSLRLTSSAIPKCIFTLINHVRRPLLFLLRNDDWVIVKTLLFKRLNKAIGPYVTVMSQRLLETKQLTQDLCIEQVFNLFWTSVLWRWI